MKKIYGLLALTAVLASACKKEDTNGGNAQLQGRWKSTQVYLGTGGPTDWQNVQTVTDVTFGSNGQVSGNAFAEYVNYTLKDSITITFKKADGGSQDYYYKIKHDTLQMSPGAPMFCYEGCGIRFKKAK
ncbi:hypothetical protein C8P68_10585 [Mucilaginibacter yixingensis]|uniref:Lipocalin-like protein n=1 Tax=Mucilaginibacter yixingensis TaxID=1295612 RepID=A0A2T5J801_9SPHI|nr:hypothetical protein [Mucilaginibacter yixingensis]PTQ95580.1 hypothetical protein C8P68_10585 [Mucilaginibacter yixingensis]